MLKMASVLDAFPYFLFNTTPLCRPDNCHIR